MNISPREHHQDVYNRHYVANIGAAFGVIAAMLLFWLFGMNVSSAPATAHTPANITASR
ncbi:MAG TPA: hypothetical protein VMU25_02570 [Candidatus Paceibacterota bacterium]|nr:hypothetical protein [Candidatus Paceibacterota bacterium]